MKWLFGFRKESPTTVEDIRKVGSSMIRIQSLDIFGPYSESEDGEYLLIRQDSDRERGIGGYRNSGNGRFALVKKGQVIYVGECERPTEGEVSNTGTFAITDTLFGDNLGSKLYVYSGDGTLRFSHMFTANMLNIGISVQGTHVLAQLCNSDTEDSGKLYLFDIRQSKVISAFVPETGWADKYEFSVPDKIVYLCYKNSRRYAYSFDGIFLDSHRYDHERVEDASPTDLILIVREKMNGSTQEQLPSLLSMISKAFEGNLNDYHDYHALAYRLKGEIQESMGNVEQAISAYQKALNIDPKVGVKQRLKKLEKEIKLVGSSGSTKKRTKLISKPPKLSPISCAAVQEVLYNFTQYAFIGGSIKAEPLDIKHFPTVLTILRSGTLRQQDLATQSLQVQRVFYELLSQYMMFLAMNPELPFPPDFLTQSSAKALGSQVTAYMAEHKWPFPQMLQQR
jgi:tetratricopeptide (TPR) repeat protein